MNEKFASCSDLHIYVDKLSANLVLSPSDISFIYQECSDFFDSDRYDKLENIDQNVFLSIMNSLDDLQKMTDPTKDIQYKKINFSRLCSILSGEKKPEPSLADMTYYCEELKRYMNENVFQQLSPGDQGALYAMLYRLSTMIDESDPSNTVVYKTTNFIRLDNILEGKRPPELYVDTTGELTKRMAGEIMTNNTSK